MAPQIGAFTVVQFRLYWQLDDVVSTSLRYIQLGNVGNPGDPWGLTVPLDRIAEEYSEYIAAYTRWAMSEQGWYRGLAARGFWPTQTAWAFSKAGAGRGNWPEGTMPPQLGLTLRLRRDDPYSGAVTKGRMSTPAVPISFAKLPGDGPNETGIFWGNFVAQWFAGGFYRPGTPPYYAYNAIFSERDNGPYQITTWSVSPTWATFCRRAGWGSKIAMPPELA